MSVSPSAIAFSNQALNTTSAPSPVTLRNNQSTAVTITNISNPGGGFAVSSTTCGTLPANLPASSSCTINVTFDPTTATAASGTLSVTTSQSPTALPVSLSGLGITAVSVSPGTVSFGNAAVGYTSAIQTVTLSNNQSSGSLTNLSLSVSGSGFALDPSTQCASGGSLAAGASCTVALTVNPGGTGSLTGTLSIADTQGSNPPAVSLTANGIVPVTLSPSSESFPGTVENTTSATQTVTLRNNQPTPLTISSVVVGGQFAVVTGSPTTCPITGGTLPATGSPGSSCVIGLVYKPTAMGAVTGQITIGDSAASSPQFTTLTGTGLAAVNASPGTLAFGSAVIGAASPTQNITLTNNQSIALNIVSINVPSPYALVPATTTCVAGPPCLQILRAQSVFR